MITRYAKYAREKGRQKFISDGGFNVVDFDGSSIYPTMFDIHIQPYETEANLMVSRIMHELKNKHNMTKKKHRFLTSKLMKYLPFTSNSRRYPMPSLASDFDGDVLFRCNLLTPENPETSTSRQMMFGLIKPMPGENNLFEPSISINTDFSGEEKRLRPFISRNAIDREIAKHFIEAGKGRKAMVMNNIGAGKAHSLEFMHDTEAFTERYTCLCGQDVGKAKEGKTCELCNSKVKLIDIEKENELMKEIYGNEYIALSNEDIKKLEEGTHENLTIQDEYLFKKALSTGTKKAYGVHIKLEDCKKITGRYGDKGVVGKIDDDTTEYISEHEAQLLLNAQEVVLDPIKINIRED